MVCGGGSKMPLKEGKDCAAHSAACAGNPGEKQDRASDSGDMQQKHCRAQAQEQLHIFRGMFFFRKTEVFKCFSHRIS